MKLFKFLFVSVFLAVSATAATTNPHDFSTVADMVAAPAPALGDIAICAGRNAIGDGGGGVFVAKTITTSTNLAIIYAANNADTVKWFRDFDGPINAKWFGARPDDSKDDSAALQAALNYVTDLVVPGTTNPNAKQLYIPHGVYNMSRGIWADDTTGSKPSGNTTFAVVGDGPRATWLKADRPFLGDSIFAVTNISYITVRDIGVDGGYINNTGPTAAPNKDVVIGWNFEQANNAHWENLTAYGCGTGFRYNLQLNGSSVMNNLRAYENYLGMDLLDIRVTEANLFCQKNVWGAELHAGGNVVIHGVFQGSIEDNLHVSGRNITLDGVYMEAGKQHLVLGKKIDGTIRGASNVSVRNFNLSPGKTFQPIRMFSAHDVEIELGNFGLGSSSVYMDANCYNIDLKGDSFYQWDTASGASYSPPVTLSTKVMNPARNIWPDPHMEDSGKSWFGSVAGASTASAVFQATGGFTTPSCLKVAVSYATPTVFAHINLSQTLKDAIEGKPVRIGMRMFVPPTYAGSGWLPTVAVLNGTTRQFLATGSRPDGWWFMYNNNPFTYDSTVSPILAIEVYPNRQGTANSSLADTWVLLDDFVMDEGNMAWDDVINADWYHDPYGKMGDMASDYADGTLITTASFPLTVTTNSLVNLTNAAPTVFASTNVWVADENKTFHHIASKETVVRTFSDAYWDNLTRVDPAVPGTVVTGGKRYVVNAAGNAVIRSTETPANGSRMTLAWTGTASKNGTWGGSGSWGNVVWSNPEGNVITANTPTDYVVTFTTTAPNAKTILINATLAVGDWIEIVNAREITVGPPKPPDGKTIFAAADNGVWEAEAPPAASLPIGNGSVNVASFDSPATSSLTITTVGMDATRAVQVVFTPPLPPGVLFEAQPITNTSVRVDLINLSGDRVSITSNAVVSQ